MRLESTYRSNPTVLVAASDAPGHVKRAARFVCDGVADDVQIQAAIDSLPAGGGDVELAGSTFNTTATILLDEGSKRIRLSGYGAAIVTSGAIWGVTVNRMGSTVNPPTVEGLTVNQRANTDALGGFRVIGCWNTRIKDCTVVADGTNASYVAAAQVENEDEETPGTGSFWTTFENFWVRKFTGSDTGTIPIGINLIGNSNSTRIYGGGINNCDDAIRLAAQGSEALQINHVALHGVAIEACTDGVVVDGEGVDSGGGSGLSIVQCRFESTTNLLHVANRDNTGWAIPPFLMGNFISSNVTNYTAYTNSTGAATRINALDFMTTPNIQTPTFDRGAIFRSRDGTDWPVSAHPVGGNRGFQLFDNGGVQRGAWVWLTGTRTELKGTAAQTFNISGLRSLSQTTTKAENLRGSVTIEGTDTTGAVTFGTAEPDATYFISVTPSALSASAAAPGNVWVTSKATSGFTINIETAPGASESVTLDWHLIR